MSYKHYLTLLFTLFMFLSCSQVPEEDFYIMQDGKNHGGDEISIERKPFTIVSKSKEYAFVFSPQPIKMLADHKDIVKLVGTGAAWSKGDGMLYKDSDLLSDNEACDAYFGYRKEGCQLYIKRKTALGFRRHYAYTFGAYYVSPKEWKINSINDVKMKDAIYSTYYLYLFKATDKLGEVAYAEHVTRIKINLK